MTPNFQHPIESILDGARADNEELFGGASEEYKLAMENKIALDKEERETIALAWARFYESPEGRKALELMFSTTIRRTVSFVQLGFTAEQVGLFGAFREGQNALATEIARQIALGLDVKQPEPREAGQ